MQKVKLVFYIERIIQKVKYILSFYELSETDQKR